MYEMASPFISTKTEKVENLRNNLKVASFNTHTWGQITYKKFLFMNYVPSEQCPLKLDKWRNRNT